MEKIFYLLNHKMTISEEQNTYILYRKLFKALAEQQVRRFQNEVSRLGKVKEVQALKIPDIMDTVLFEGAKRANEMLYDLQIFEMSPEMIYKRFEMEYKDWRTSVSLPINPEGDALIENLSEVVYKKCMQMQGLFLDYLIERHLLVEKAYEEKNAKQKAKAIIQKVNNRRGEEAVIQEQLISAIEVYPFGKEAYINLLNLYGPSKELYDLAEYFGTDIRNEIKGQLMQEVLKLPHHTVESIEQIVKVIKMQGKVYPLINFRPEIEAYEAKIKGEPHMEEDLLENVHKNRVSKWVGHLKKHWKKT